MQAVEVVGTVNGVASLLVVPEPDAEVAQEVSELIRRNGFAIDEMVVEQGRLDDVFRSLTSRPH